MTTQEISPEVQAPDAATPVVTRLMFLPVKVASKRLAPRLSARLFERIWGLIDDQGPPPRAEQREAPFGKLALALALEGACTAIVSGLLDHASRQKFARTTGRWPGRRAKS